MILDLTLKPLFFLLFIVMSILKAFLVGFNLVISLAVLLYLPLFYVANKVGLCKN